MTEPIEPPEGEVEGPTEPIPGGQPSTPPQPSGPVHGTYLSRNAGRRASLLEGLGTVITQAKLDDELGGITNEVHNLGTVVADYGDILERKVEPWAVPTVAPLSQTINRRADPTFQLSDFMVPLVRGRSDQESHNHTHITTSTAFQLQRGANLKNRAYLAFLTPAINRAYSQLNFMVSEVTSPCRMDVAIYVVDENRQMHRQVLQTDITPGLGESVATVTFPRWVATQGSYIAVAWLQTGTGNTRSILGLDDTPRPLLNTVFPRKISAIHTSTSLPALPATINGETQVDFDYWFTPYAELSEDVGVDYRVFTESWPDVGLIGRPWVALTSSGVYSAGGRVRASGFGYRVSMYDTPLSTDHVRVRTSIATMHTNNVRRSTVVVRGSNDMRSGVGFSAINRDSTGGRYELIQWSNVSVDSSWDARTVVAALDRLPVAGEQIEIDYLDGLVDVRINGVAVITGQAVTAPTGPGGRFVGIQVERTGNVFAAYQSPEFGPWSARDLPQANGDEDDG